MLVQLPEFLSANGEPGHWKHESGVDLTPFYLLHVYGTQTYSTLCNVRFNRDDITSQSESK